MGRPASKKQLAFEILDRLHAGPHTGNPAGDGQGPITREEYNRWVSMWVLPHLPDLIPQTKGEIVAEITSGNLIKNRDQRRRNARTHPAYITDKPMEGDY